MHLPIAWLLKTAFAFPLRRSRLQHCHRCVLSLATRQATASRSTASSKKLVQQEMSTRDERATNFLSCLSTNFHRKLPHAQVCLRHDCPGDCIAIIIRSTHPCAIKVDNGKASENGRAHENNQSRNFPFAYSFRHPPDRWAACSCERCQVIVPRS